MLANRRRERRQREESYFLWSWLISVYENIVAIEKRDSHVPRSDGCIIVNTQVAVRHFILGWYRYLFQYTKDPIEQARPVLHLPQHAGFKMKLEMYLFTN